MKERSPDFWDRDWLICVRIIGFIPCAILVVVGAILAILGVGNLLNGGHYIRTGPSLILTGMSVAALAGAFYLGRFIVRLKR